MGVQVIPIPTEVASHSSLSHYQFCVLFPFPWDSHGIPGPIGNPIPMHISNVYVCLSHIIKIKYKKPYQFYQAFKAHDTYKAANIFLLV